LHPALARGLKQEANLLKRLYETLFSQSILFNRSLLHAHDGGRLQFFLSKS
jgi:hypothetical protein